MLNFVVASVLFSAVSFALLYKGQRGSYIYQSALRFGSLFWSKWLAIAAVCFIFTSIGLNILSGNPDANSVLIFAPLLTPFELVLILFVCLLLLTPGALIACISLILYLTFRAFSQISLLNSNQNDPYFFALMLLIGSLGTLALLVDRLPWIHPNQWRNTAFGPSDLRKMTLFFLMTLSLIAFAKCCSQMTSFLSFYQETFKYSAPKYNAVLILSIVLLSWISIGFFGPTPPLLFALPIPSLIVWSYANPFGHQAIIVPFLLLLSLLVFPQEKRTILRG